MPMTRSTPEPVARPTAGDRNRRYLTPGEIKPPPEEFAASAAIVSVPPPRTAPVPAAPPVPVGDELIRLVQEEFARAAPPAASGAARSRLVREELARAAQSGTYIIQNLLARGAESVLYRASAGHATFCAKVIRNLLGMTIGSAATRSHHGKLDDVSYRNKVRHLRNEFAVGGALREDDDIPIVRIYALRKVRRFGLEMGYDLLMEHIEGADMSDRQFTRGLSLADKVGIFHQTVKALGFMHHRRYIHLDMKPSNIMVTQGRVKLIDFGVSVTLGHQPRAVTGTAGYLSPEQIVRESLTEATDIFALGVTFAVIFGGKPLLQTAEELKSRHLRSEARYHLTTVDQPTIVAIPELAEYPDLALLIGQCTVPRLDRRISNTGALLSRLERAAAEYGISLPKASPAPAANREAAHE
jgi:serine/threonine protein kinase